MRIIRISGPKGQCASCKDRAIIEVSVASHGPIFRVCGRHAGFLSEKIGEQLQAHAAGAPIPPAIPANIRADNWGNR